MGWTSWPLRLIKHSAFWRRMSHLIKKLWNQNLFSSLSKAFTPFLPPCPQCSSTQATSSVLVHLERGEFLHWSFQWKIKNEVRKHWERRIPFVLWITHNIVINHNTILFDLVCMGFFKWFFPCLNTLDLRNHHS